MCICILCKWFYSCSWGVSVWMRGNLYSTLDESTVSMQPFTIETFQTHAYKCNFKETAAGGASLRMGCHIQLIMQDNFCIARWVMIVLFRSCKALHRHNTACSNTCYYREAGSGLDWCIVWKKVAWFPDCGSYVTAWVRYCSSPGYNSNTVHSHITFELAGILW